MILPLHTDSPLRRTPWMNWLLIAANVAVFLFQRASGNQQPVGVLSPHDLQLWNYISYQFLHANMLHLAGNMLFLYIFGNNVNDRMGQLGYLAFYLAGGVFAGIGHVLTSGSPVLGASGAVSAVTGAYLVLLPKSHITIFFFLYLIGTYEIPAMFFIIASFGMDFFYNFSPYDNGVAHAAHLSGSLFGFFICFILLSVRLLPRSQFDLFALATRWNRRRQYRGMVSQGFDPFSGAPRGGSNVISPDQGRVASLRALIAESLAGHQPGEAAKVYLELHAIDPSQILSRQNQLDVANELYSQGIFPAAADAYEGFLKLYPKHERVSQVHLMLGLIYARYLQKRDEAKQHLTAVAEQIHGGREVELAREELAQLG